MLLYLACNEDEIRLYTSTKQLDTLLADSVEQKTFKNWINQVNKIEVDNKYDWVQLD